MGRFGGILLARIWEMRSRDGILGDKSEPIIRRGLAESLMCSNTI